MSGWTVIRKKTRITGTVHTSAKARVTSVAIWIRIRIRIRDPNRDQNLIICSLAHCQPCRKISCKSIQKFLCKVANRQTDKQTTNNHNCIASLAEVVIHLVVTRKCAIAEKHLKAIQQAI